ncbi:KH homology domain-containing protein 4-like [Brachyhypopomus gauderio]|uniref:KH homology domain-containing protein 4-like n=1 Tax=Brachyhypopomus gauderio TaxID=698409 RepID=UPI004042442E
MQMASGTPCLNSRWDQPKSKTDMLQGILGNVSHALSTHVGSAPVNSAATGPSSAIGNALFSTAQSAAGACAPAQYSTAGSTPPQGGVEMAAAMAAKINAMLMAKGKLKPLQPLPSKAPPCVLPPSSNEEVVVTEVDINDVPVNCRNLLTKGKTQEEIRQHSGAVVSTKGLYMSDAEKSTNTGVERPLYLHVQGRTQDEVNKAVMRIKEIISEDVLRASGGQQPAVMPPVPVYPQPPRPATPAQPLRPHLPPNSRPPNAPVTPAHRPPPPHSGSFVHTKIFVGLDQSLPAFNVNERVEGPNGSYLQHIQTETGARVFLRGKGSGYIEQASRRESFEPLYLYISHPNPAGLEAAKKLCESLLETVRAEHARMLSVYTATGSTQVYPNQGYPSGSTYSSQSWYGYPSAYPAYPASGGYWGSSNGSPSQASLSSTPPSQGMVQYPVCSRQQATFLLQEEGRTSEEKLNDDSSSQKSRSPKRHFLENSDKIQEIPEPSNPNDPVKTVSGVDESRSDGMLMPPPPVPVSVLPTMRKRPIETESSDPAHSHPAPVEDEGKRLKVTMDSSGLVPYGGDSSDEEEERTRSEKTNSS